MKTNENLTEKLKYIGLDLENIPDRLYFFNNINFKVRKNYNEKNYKVYKYINVDDIDIYLTPTHRLTDYTEKCAKALPIGAYLDNDTEENIERHVQFIKLLKELQIGEIEELEEQQKKLNKSMPYNIKFHKDYLWQIYYSEELKRYFMLAPINESECSSVFYVIKKQLEKKNKKIYVPICYSEYSNKFLNASEIEELEKYLCFFAKEWPLVYEVYDKEENLSIQIVGKANIYDTVKSEYKITLNNQGDAEDFYKLLKVLFILETQLSHHFKINIRLDKKGDMSFYYNDKQITYKTLVSFIKNEYVKGLEKSIKAKETKINLETKLKSLKKIAKRLDEEYFEKEKHISTFLECKKTFLGRVKYFIKYKKKKSQAINDTTIEKEERSKFKYCERTEIKDSYTLEELLSLYTNLDQETNSIKDLELDIDAINKRIDTLRTKIENATLYIKEIDAHKKSIFEFWKFTNKDEAKQLNEGMNETHKTKKLKKTFNYDSDFESVSKQFDKTAREIFTKDETDNIYLATTNMIEDINNVLNGDEFSSEQFKELMNELRYTDRVMDFDIFGGISSSNDEIKTLGNIRHREEAKNKFAILSLNNATTLDDYASKVKRIANSIEGSMNKFKNTIEIPIYKTGSLDNGLNIFYMNPESALKDLDCKETNLYKIVLKENVNFLPLTNIMYYNNNNLTLPWGMNVTDGVLINTNKLIMGLKSEEQNYVVKAQEDASKPNNIKLNIFEYEIC